METESSKVVSLTQRKSKTRHFDMDEKKVVIIELEKRIDGSAGLGNSYQVPMSEAIEKVKAGLAKFEGLKIGELPKGSTEEVLDNGGN